MFASIDSGALDSFISRFPSLISEYWGGKSCSPSFSSCVLSWSGFCSVDILYRVFISVFPRGWFLFSRKLFPGKWSDFNCSRVECWTFSTETYRHSLVGLFSTTLFDLFVSRNCCICLAAGCIFLSSIKNKKSLMKFCWSVFQVNVSPLASSILYHLLGKSLRVEGNRWGHIHSSW